MLSRYVWGSNSFRSSPAHCHSPPEQCILALDPTASGAVTVAFLAAIQLTGCSLFSDSSSSSSIEVFLLAEITASGGGTIGTVGNVSDFLGFISPAPFTHVSPPIADPYAGYQTPAPTIPGTFKAPSPSCTHISFNTKKSQTLASGTTYCAVTVSSGDSITAGAGGTYQFYGGITVNGGTVTLAGTTTLDCPTAPPCSAITVNSGTATLNAGTYSVNGNIVVNGGSI